MNIKRVKLKGYRNYIDEDIEFGENVNLIIGDNAQGKTNILEAIYLSGMGRSFRSTKDKELIMMNKDHLYVELELLKDDRCDTIKTYINDMKEKSILINDTKVRKMSELIGYMKLVIFKPEDLLLIKQGPSDRRRFLDTEISQISRNYLVLLQKYNKSLLQKNNYLKNSSRINKDELSIWNSQLVKYGRDIIKYRTDYIEKLNEKIDTIHKSITTGKERLHIIYEKSVEIDNYEKEMDESYNDEIRIRSSKVGPHKDDIIFMINDFDIKKYGSQGQQRTAILSLKFSQIEIIEDETGEMPILLLDDVLSELDEDRQIHMIKYINRMQTILTSTDVPEKIKKNLEVEKLYKVEGGKIQSL